MRKVVTVMIMMLFVFSFCVLPITASAYIDATSRIQIYYQQYASTNSWSKLSLNSGETMGTAGCLIFAYAHAIQWFTGVKETGTALLTSMISEGGSPWTYSIGYYASKNTCSSRGIHAVSGSVTSSNIKSILDNGQVIFANTSFQGKAAGHYVLAVDSTYKDVDGDGSSDTLIHIVDSAVNATYRRFVAENANDRNNNHYSRGFSMYNISSFAEITSCPSESCGQYWVKAPDFISGMDKARQILGYSGAGTITMPSAMTIEMGTQEHIQASMGSITNFFWSSSNSDIVRVNDNGFIYGNNVMYKSCQ